MGFGLEALFKGNEADREINPFSSILGALGSGITAGATSKFANNLFGTTAADESLNVANALYPGTSGPERLHAGGGGAAGAGAMESLSSKALTAQINQAKRSVDIQQRGQETSKEIAKIQADAQIEAAKIGARRVTGPFGIGFNWDGFNSDRNSDGLRDPHTIPVPTPEQTMEYFKSAKDRASTGAATRNYNARKDRSKWGNLNL